MNKRTLRAAILSALAIGSVLGAASPASADHTGFEKREYQVDESAGYVELVVGTSCCPPGSGQIDYYTSNLSAIAGDDYQQTSGTLTFPAEYKIRVPIIDDELFEGEEQFEVRLTNYRGTFINNMGRTTAAVVRIVDDDPKPSSSSTSSSRSSEQTVRSAGRSSARPPSPQSAASGSADAGVQSARVTAPTAGNPVHQDDLALSAETDDRDHAGTVDRRGERGKSDPSSSLILVALGTLLLVAGAGLGLKKRLGRRST